MRVRNTGVPMTKAELVELIAAETGVPTSTVSRHLQPGHLMPG